MPHMRHETCAAFAGIDRVLSAALFLACTARQQHKETMPPASAAMIAIASNASAASRSAAPDAIAGRMIAAVTGQRRDAVAQHQLPEPEDRRGAGAEHQQPES